MRASPANYLLWLLFFIWLPAVFLWWINLGEVRKHARALVACSVLLAVMCLPVEYWIVHKALVMHRGHFLGLFLWGIPLEDYLFFFSFPFLLAPLALKLESSIYRDKPC